MLFKYYIFIIFFKFDGSHPELSIYNRFLRIRTSTDSIDLFGFSVAHIDISEHTHIWRHLPFHKTSGKRHWCVPFGPFSLALLSRRGFSSLKASRRIRKDNPSRVPIVSPFSLLFFSFSFSCILFYGAQCKLPKDWKQHGQPCVLRASGRWIIIVSCLTQPRPHVMWPLLLRVRPRKAQIAKNNIVGWRGRK